ncbi:unnamed protein product [Mytilus coruscus]|uniref:C-type lectin domain-containing protein n=1 Tax=Mytilus coruscus TaxID=42192 RepID=A0A6J8CF04_MYTCO|nr:unnamed protein product [Mytilus coruscus]
MHVLSVTGFPETTVTWIDAALHCYVQHTILENNITILTEYINASNSTESIWVGSFVASLQWIEIRGCYNISADIDTVTDISNVEDPAVCQVKCMKTWKTNIQYFGFNKHEHRCVCFEDKRLVSEVSGSLCSICSAARTCDRFVDVYKVFNRSVINSTDEDNFCLARNCSSTETPTYSQSNCESYFKAYCHTICNKKQPGDSNVMYWVGVYRQKLDIRNLDKLVDELSTTDYVSTVTTFVTSDIRINVSWNCDINNCGYTDNNCDTSINVEKVSISVNQTSKLIIELFRTHSKKLLPLNTAGGEDGNTNEMDNYTVISDYQQLDNVDDLEKRTKAYDMYDQLHVTRIEEIDLTNGQSNTSFSREEYSKYESIDTNEIDNSTVTSEYEQLDNAEKDTRTKAYDQLHVKHVVNTDTPNYYSKNLVSTKEHNNDEPIEKATAIDKNTVISEYEQLDNAKNDKSINVYDQLLVTHVIDNDLTNYHSKTMISREEHSKNEPTDEINKLDKSTVSPEYEQ